MNRNFYLLFRRINAATTGSELILFLLLLLGTIDLQAQQSFNCTWNEPAQSGTTFRNFEDDGTDPTPDGAGAANALTSFSYTIPGNTLGVGDGGIAGVVPDNPVSIIIDFSGDISSANEQFDVTVEGLPTRTVSSPGAQTFTLSVAQATTALANGQITVTYDNFRSDWWPQTMIIPDPNDEDELITVNRYTGNNNFSASVRGFSFSYSFDLDLMMGVNICTNESFDLGALVEFQTAASAKDNFYFNGVYTDSTFYANMGDLGINTIEYRFTCADGQMEILPFNIVVEEVPNATLENGVVGCGGSSNTYNLTALFGPNTTEGGEFSSTTVGATIVGNTLTYNGFGCVDITYTLQNLNDCPTPGMILTDNATVFFKESATPAFFITSSTACWEGDDPLEVEVEAVPQSYTGNPNVSVEWTATPSKVLIDGDQVDAFTISLANPNSSVPTITISDPVSAIGNLTICYEETISSPTTDCPIILDDTDCETQVCQTIAILSTGCNEECLEFDPAATVCPVSTNPFITISAFDGALSVNIGDALYPLFEASVVSGEYVDDNIIDLGGDLPPLISCTEPGIDVSWDYIFNQDAFEFIADAAMIDLQGPIITQIPGFGGVCQGILWDIRLPVDVCLNCEDDGNDYCASVLVVDACIRMNSYQPLSFLDFPVLDDFTICTVSIQDIILDPLQEIVAQTAVSVVWADTDGDGAFDYPIVEGGIILDGSSQGTAFVPNNVEGEGVITVRNLTASFIPPSAPCVDPTGVNLIEYLPIDLIPIAGPMINQVLSTAGLDVNVAPSAHYDLPIRVANDQAPLFLNPKREYTFATGAACGEAVNWSIPIAVDGCTGEIVQDVIQTGGPLSGSILEPMPNEVHYIDSYNNPYYVDVNGNEVPLCQKEVNGVMEYVIVEYLQDCADDRNETVVDFNDYEPLLVSGYRVDYQATSCNGMQTLHSTYINVVPGNPVLQVPNDLVMKTDIDECARVVQGIRPIQGLDCNTTVTWTADNGANPSSGIGDASGTVFQSGTTTVIYTMTADLNGDGVIDPNDPMIACGELQETQICSFQIVIQDGQKPTASCRDFEIQLDEDGSAVVTVEDIDGGSTDNCPGVLNIEIAKPGEDFGSSVNFDCLDEGQNTVILRVVDAADFNNDGDTTTDDGNEKRCLALVTVVDYFEGFVVSLDVPELCIDTNNPEQLDFTNYLTITDPGQQVLTHEQELTDGDQVFGVFSITGFVSSNNDPIIQGDSPDNPGTAGFVDPITGEYTPGSGTGFVSISYVLGIGQNEMEEDQIAPDPAYPERLIGCFVMANDVFELRQPLEMDSPECECISQNDRIVNLGEITGGLEPYTIQYGGVKLDVDNDGIADDMDGEFTYQESFTGSSGIMINYDITNFTEDLGNLLVDYTQPTWSFTIVDARGCELFRSGSCDNDDETGYPMIDCTALGAVTLYTRNEEDCTVQDTWEHTLPRDNCDVILYTYTIENPDGTIAGPFDISALLNPDITMPLPDQFYGEYDFQHHTPTENVSTVTYYAEDAVGNFSQCSFTVTVIDDDPPYFINCPEPAVIVDAPPTWCAAFANYSLPLAEDNCGSVTVTQIDDTSLTSGSLFPVGITINTFEAVDESGNSITCDVKIIVNDYHTPPTLECPDEVTTTNDGGDCGAIVTDIAPSGITDNCPENLTVVYRIQDEEGNEVASGFDDASGNFFDLGTNTVEYSVQDMPLLLITEVTHELSNTVDGSPATTPSCFDGVINGDETGVDCGGGVCASCNCPENEVIVEIVLDNNPGETTWAITEPNDGAVLASGGPYPSMAGMTITESVCLSNDCYDFVIRDAGLDGITAAGGSYTVTAGDKVLASGGDFGTREVTNLCLDGAPPASSLVGTAGSRDAIEITNFGSANLDVSCLMIERFYAGGSESYGVPAGVILASGGVLTIHFGDGHDDPVNNVYYVPGTTDLAIDEPTAYIVSLSRSVLDVAVMNGFDVSGVLVPPAYDLGGLTVANYWSGTVGPLYGGGIVRTTVWDTNTAADFVPGEACTPTTIGTLNPMLPQPASNGALTAIQAQPTTRLECSFTVDISDNEVPVCGLYGDYNNYPGSAATIDYGKCVELPITVTDAYSIADLNLLLAGNGGDFGNLTFTLISPEGTVVELLDAICSGSSVFDLTLDGDPELADLILDNCANIGTGEAFVPVGNIEAFNGEAVQGTWVLQIAHNGQVDISSTDLVGWSLDISAREAYTQGNETLDNDLDLCGAEFTWLHAILFDNCAGGSVAFTITFEDGTVEVSQTLPIFPENTPFTHFFQVGVTQVNYTLTDAAGKTSSCGFEVDVRDVQSPEITCPPDLVIQLDPGECETQAYPTTPIFEYDNCPDYVLSSFPPGTPVPIGDTVITLIITDASGNVTECTYNLTVLEHVPTGNIACIADLNVSLGADCMTTITAEMILSGGDYRCYDNYDITLYPDLPDTGVDPISTSPVIGEEFVGQTIIAEICDPATGFCCWGYVHVDFYDAPEFICPLDATVSCIESTHPNALGYPEVTSCVPGGATIEFDDEIVDNGTCGDPRLVITRTWTVSDGVGNSSQCVQTIVMEAFDLMQIDFPENYDGIDNPVLDCAAVLDDPSLTSIESLGVPTIEGYSLYTAGYCTAAMNFEDDVFTICENSYIIFRQWRVINQCLPDPLATVSEFTQTIRVEDIDGPELVCPENETISVSPLNCQASYLVPPLVSVDACSDVTYQVEIDGDTLVYNPDNYYVLTGLDLGPHTIRYLASDACGKLSNCAYTLTVKDLIAPTAICNDELIVSLGGGDILNGQFGEARILASDIDEGTNDNCSAVDLAVRRNLWLDGDCDASPEQWSPWGGFIDFYCCDINQEVTIELLVTDIYGNENTCWTVVTPEDKLTPYCYAPEDVSLTCTDLPLTFPGDIQIAYDEDFAATSISMNAIFGAATGTDNCAVDTIVERTPNIQINECGWGMITRRFEAWQLKPEGDVNGNGAIDINEVHRSTNSCSQEIEITEVHDFVIDFPEDADADCGTPDVPTILTETAGCDVLSVNIGDPVQFSATGDECYKLSITYDVINWCLWDGEFTGHLIARMTEDDGEALPIDRAVEGNERPVITYDDVNGLCIDRRHADRDGDSFLPDCESPELANYGRYIYTQFIKVYDSSTPVVAVGDYGGPTDNCPDLLPGQFGDEDGNCEVAVSIPFTVTDECELFDGEGVLIIEVVSAELDAFAVDANGDGAISSNEFSGDDDASQYLIDNEDGTYVLSGNFPVISSAMGDNIYHAVRILLEDGCGNQTSQTLLFDVIDCKGPAPICINGLTVTLMPVDPGTDADNDGDVDGCAMTIWAADFEASPIYDCTGQGPEADADGAARVSKYAIYRASEVEANPNFMPHPTHTGLVLTDDDDETVVVYVYAFDEDGNYDYCETYVLVQLHGSCGESGTGTIAGVITTSDSEAIEGVEVNVSGAAQTSMITTTDGAYTFPGLLLGEDYSITPYLDANPLNGVSTFDIVLISKHILNVDPLDSPYRLLAADVNNSGTITTLDIIQIRKLILNVITSFENNTSWRFLPADYAFPNDLDPWQETFPELININDLPSDIVDADFIGVKTGDVNGNAQANSLAGDDRTLNGTFHLAVEDIDLKTGNTYTVAFTGEDMANIQGFQGTLQWTDLELLDLEYGAATSANFGLMYANQGMLTTSWNQPSGSSVADGEVLFSLVLRASRDAKLSELLQVSSRYTMAEAYQGETTTDLGLSFSSTAASPGTFVLYQNVPNPFAEGTMIAFDLPANASTTITIRDAKGALLRVIEGEYTAGYHTVRVTKQMINNTAGVLTYTLEAGDYRATRQMIVVD